MTLASASVPEVTPEQIVPRGCVPGVPIGHDPNAVPERLDRVQVATGQGSVEISWASGAAIVRELHQNELAGAALRAFEAAGASRPVQLERSTWAAVIDAINVLAERAGGVRHLEPGVAKLQRTLTTELHAAWAAEDASRGFFTD